MKSIAIFLLFIGTVLIIQGYYSNFSSTQKTKTIIKYVPSTVYNEKVNEESNLDDYYKGIFEKTKSSK